MLVKLHNGVPVEWPVNENRIKHEYPNVSFPRDFTKIDVAAYGYAKFKFSDPQSYDAEYQTCTEVDPVLDGDTYVQAWSIADKYTAEERAVYDAKKASDAALGLEASIRSQRDRLLAETDYLALSDTTLSPEMATYRQALRDITEQAGFPHEVTWPVKP